MRIFITGIAGFLGSHLADWLLDRGHQVAGCDTLFGGEYANVPHGARFHLHDITQLDGYAGLLRGTDVVVHCAAAAYEGMSVFAPAFISHNIYAGSATTFSAALQAGVPRVVFCSSMARYGVNTVPFRETMVPAPVDPYGLAKLAAEHLLENLATTHGFAWTIAVPHNIYGPRQRYCLARGTLVKLADGFKPIEAVTTGDRVLIAGATAPVTERIALGARPALRLTLGNGQTVIAGRDHLFKRLGADDRLEWIAAAQLVPGDPILAEQSVGVTIARASPEFRFGQLLGLLSAAGRIERATNQVTVACRSAADRADLRALLDATAAQFTEWDWHEPSPGRFSLTSAAFIAYLDALGLATPPAPERTIPVLAMTHASIAGALSGLFSADGWVDRDLSTVALASTAEPLIRQVQRLLLAYGMEATIAPRPDHADGGELGPVPIWQLTLLGEHLDQFAAIGFVYQRQDAALRTLIERRPQGITVHHVLHVTAIEPTMAELFDLSVDAAHHSYIGDGLVCHNCDPYRNVAAIMTNLMLQDRAPLIYGDGNQYRCFSYIADCLDPLGAMTLGEAALGRVVNIGPDEEFVTINELARRLGALTGNNRAPIHLPARPQEVREATCSADQARALLGYRTTVSLDTGLGHLVADIRRRGPRAFAYHFSPEFLTPAIPQSWSARLL